MELPSSSSSSAITNGFQRNTTTCPPFSLFTATTFSIITTRRDKTKRLQLSIATQQAIVSPTTSRKPYVSDSYSARRTHLLQIQESSDFQSDIQRLGGTLKVQDLNVLIRHFGNLNKWQELSQLFEWMQKHEKLNASSYSSYIKFLGKSL